MTSGGDHRAAERGVVAPLGHAPPCREPLERCQLLPLTVVSDSRGSLVVAQPPYQVPFDIRRAFAIHGVPAQQERAHHANRHVDELLIAVTGACAVRVRSPTASASFRLDSPVSGLYVPAMTWLELADFASNTVLLVLASLPYDPDEHVTSFEDFVALVDSGKMDDGH